jgi:hypothetical protein
LRKILLHPLAWDLPQRTQPILWMFCPSFQNLSLLTAWNLWILWQISFCLLRRKEMNDKSCKNSKSSELLSSDLKEKRTRTSIEDTVMIGMKGSLL